MDSSAIAFAPSPMLASAPAGRKGQKHSQKVHASATGTARGIRIHALARAPARCFLPEKCARCTPPPLPTLPLALNLFRWTPMMTRRATKVTLPLPESHGPGYSSARGSYARSRVRALAAREHQQGQCDTAGRQNHVHRHSGPHLERAGGAGRATGQAVGRHACKAAGNNAPAQIPPPPSTSARAHR